MSQQATTEQLKQTLQEQGVKYALGGYVDIHGMIKGKFVPLEHLGRMMNCLLVLHWTAYRRK